MIFFEVNFDWAVESNIIPFSWINQALKLHSFEGCLRIKYPFAGGDVHINENSTIEVNLYLNRNKKIQCSRELVHWLFSESLQSNYILVVVENNVAEYRELVPTILNS